MNSIEEQGLWKTVKTLCLNCGRGVQTRPLPHPYKPQTEGCEPMEYRCECGKVDVFNDCGQYRLWQEAVS